MEGWMEGQKEGRKVGRGGMKRREVRGERRHAPEQQQSPAR